MHKYVDPDLEKAEKSRGSLRKQLTAGAECDYTNHVGPVFGLVFERPELVASAEIGRICLPCVRGGAERERGGGLVAWVGVVATTPQTADRLRSAPLAQGGQRGTDKAGNAELQKA